MLLAAALLSGLLIGSGVTGYLNCKEKAVKETEAEVVETVEEAGETISNDEVE